MFQSFIYLVIKKVSSYELVANSSHSNSSQSFRPPEGLRRGFTTFYSWDQYLNVSSEAGKVKKSEVNIIETALKLKIK